MTAKMQIHIIFAQCSTVHRRSTSVSRSVSRDGTDALLYLGAEHDDVRNDVHWQRHDVEVRQRHEGRLRVQHVVLVHEYERREAEDRHLSTHARTHAR